MATLLACTVNGVRRGPVDRRQVAEARRHGADREPFVQIGVVVDVHDGRRAVSLGSGQSRCAICREHHPVVHFDEEGNRHIATVAWTTDGCERHPRPPRG